MTDPSREWLLAECTRLSIDSMELEGRYHDVVDERDRLRKTVDAVIAYRSVMSERLSNVNNDTFDSVAEVALAERARVLLEEMNVLLDDVANDFWHCRCGRRYPAHRRTCPSCGTVRVTP